MLHTNKGKRFVCTPPRGTRKNLCGVSWEKRRHPCPFRIHITHTHTTKEKQPPLLLLESNTGKNSLTEQPSMAWKMSWVTQVKKVPFLWKWETTFFLASGPRKHKRLFPRFQIAFEKRKRGRIHAWNLALVWHDIWHVLYRPTSLPTKQPCPPPLLFLSSGTSKKIRKKRTIFFLQLLSFTEEKNAFWIQSQKKRFLCKAEDKYGSPIVHWNALLFLNFSGSCSSSHGSFSLPCSAKLAHSLLVQMWSQLRNLFSTYLLLWFENAAGITEPPSWFRYALLCT